MEYTDWSEVAPHDLTVLWICLGSVSRSPAFTRPISSLGFFVYTAFLSLRLFRWFLDGELRLPLIIAAFAAGHPEVQADSVVTVRREASPTVTSLECHQNLECKAQGSPTSFLQRSLFHAILNDYPALCICTTVHPSPRPQQQQYCLCKYVPTNHITVQELLPETAPALFGCSMLESEGIWLV